MSNSGSSGRGSGATLVGFAKSPRQLLVLEAARYFLVSVAALAVDLGLLLVLAQWIHYAIAAVVSFLAGAVFHYLISIRLVFRRRRFGTRRLTEVVVFIGAGVGGLLVNVGIISLCHEWLGLPLVAAKLVAAGGSFAFGYVVRKLTLF